MLVLNIFLFGLPLILILSLTSFAIFKHYQFRKFNKWANKAFDEGLELKDLSTKQLFDIVNLRESPYVKMKILQKFAHFKEENNNSIK